MRDLNLRTGVSADLRSLGSRLASSSCSSAQASWHAARMLGTWSRTAGAAKVFISEMNTPTVLAVASSALPILAAWVQAAMTSALVQSSEADIAATSTATARRVLLKIGRASCREREEE